MKFLLIFLFILLAIIEGSLTTFPLVLIGLITLWILSQNEHVFTLAFFMGMLLDIFSLSPIGISSCYFIIVLFLISFYERKYEVQTVPFVFFASFFGSIGYLIWHHAMFTILQALLSGVLGSIIFVIATKKKQRITTSFHV